MDQQIINEANRLKQLAGQQLDAQLTLKFRELEQQRVINKFYGKSNFSHTGYTYANQYKTNFILETLDNKLIIINSSNSYRQDRVKQDLYDFQGITNHADIADNIIASILLYPDEEINNTALMSYRHMVQNKIAHSNATHILLFSELIQFLENHKSSVEQQLADELEEKEQQDIVKDGSYYGLRGNAFEKEVVAILNSYEYLKQLKENGSTESLYQEVIRKILYDNNTSMNDVISVSATNTVLKLNRGGTAKTDIIVILNTVQGEIIETISVKNTTKSSVSCHDYKADDFIRVLNIDNTKLADYFVFYQRFGSHIGFVEGLPEGYTDTEFTELLQPYQQMLVEWALTGNHDHENLINPQLQTSKYLLINKSDEIRFIDFESYISEIFRRRKLVYGIPLGWTHPSKQCGSRIQFKLPIVF
ncbi:MAG: hypothetical protein ACJAWO_002554 [Halieaceae bacterium]|jgi:hypothetical protein